MGFPYQDLMPLVPGEAKSPTGGFPPWENTQKRFAHAMSHARDRIAEYYRSKSAKSFRNRVLIAVPSLVFGIFIFSRAFYFPLVVTDDAMAPLIKPGTEKVFSALAPGFRKPFSLNSPDNRFGGPPRVKRGDVVALVNPTLPASSRLANIFRFVPEYLTLGFYKPDNTRLVVRRVVGLPGESVILRDKQIYINNQLFVPPWTINPGESQILAPRISGRDQMAELYIPADSVFVLCDNWLSENDSRTLGPIPIWKVHGTLRTR